MKKCMVFILAAGLLIFTGCAIPVSKSSNDGENAYTQDEVAKPSSTAGNSSEDGVKSEGTVLAEGTKSQLPVDDIQNQEKLSVVLYYQTQGGYLIPATRKVLKQEGVAKASITALIDDSINREQLEYFGLYPVLPAGTEVKGINIKDGIATIDFNSSIMDYDSELSERAIVSSIVYTLTEFRTIESVKIHIDGAVEGRLKFGTDISGALSRENVMVNSGKINLKQGSKKVDIYLLKDIENNFTYLLPVSVEYPEIKNDDVPARIIEALAKGTGSKGVYSGIPQKTRLLDSTIEGNVLTVDFNNEIKSYGGGNTREEEILNQILYSMKQVKSVKKVRIMIAGKKDTLPEGTDISGDLDIPAEINDFLDKQAG